MSFDWDLSERLIEVLSNDPTLFDDPIKAYNSAFLVTNSELHHSEIYDSRSGTMAIIVLGIGNTLFVANVGNSMAVIAVKEGNLMIEEVLSYDQIE